ncbi:MAG TPA: alpha/beta fold hydrolase [Candidatus Paceibacterota bacterium]|nr:alpha/beta fold hydrolase [Candidatus Paceibacterota bacterium]
MDKPFSVPFEHTKLLGDTMSAVEEKPSVLFFHGAGTSSRMRWQGIGELLLAQGIGSYAFDFIGHGETGGDMSSSSLASRTKQALAVVEAIKIPTPLTLIGASMGAYTALKVSEKIPVSKIIFFVPAMYDRELYEIPFGPQFTEMIRKPNSWQNSDAWAILGEFTGKLLIIAADKDETVPKEITQKIYDSAVRAEERKLYYVPGAPHQVLRALDKDPDEMKKVVSMIADFIRQK